MNVQRCKDYKHIAEHARKQLSKLKIKSTNKFWQSNSKTKKGLGTQRTVFGYDNDDVSGLGLGQGDWSGLEDDAFVADVTFTLGAGNCDEKASVYGVLASRDHRAVGSHIYRCSFSPYDHVIAIMTPLNDLIGQGLTLSDFGDDAIVLDGWAEDWWFPNIDKWDKLSHNLWRTPDPFALKVRGSSKKCNNLRIQSKIV
jgi:hypothetical protein